MNPDAPKNYAGAQLALEEAYHRLQYGDPQGAAQVALSTVPSLIEWGYIELAEQSLHQVLNWNPDKNFKAKAITYLGAIADVRSKYSSALEYFGEALELCQSIEDHAGTAELLCRIGSIHNARLEFSRSADYFHQCIQICMEQGVTNGWAASLLGLGWALQHQTTDITEVLRLYDQCVARAEATQDFETLSSVYRQIGYLIWSRRRQQVESKKYIEMALDVSRKQNLVQEIAANHAAAGSLYDEWGDFEAAEANCQQAMQLFKALGDSYGLGNTYANLGKIHESRQEFESALQFYAQSHTIAVAIQNPGTQANVALRMGIVLRQQGHVAEARMFLTEVMRLAQDYHMEETFTLAREELSQLTD
jgi:tetratricopeptide (TPR) repeat protein